jgi:membrane associated rhomboid family serine protease
MGIPLGDNAPRSSYPILTLTLIVINVLVFLYESTLGPQGFEGFVMSYGSIPKEIIQGRDIFPYSNLPSPYLTLITSMFLHANWLHLIGNMLYMWVFADNLEDRMGKFRFLCFYFICGIIASFTQIAVSMMSGNPQALSVPSIGASGAIAGIMGGYIMLFPTARVYTLWAVFIIGVIELPAFFVLGLWILTQVFSGLASFGGQALGGVAYAAHIGGFFAGLFLVKLFDRGPQGGRLRGRWRG